MKASAKKKESGLRNAALLFGLIGAGLVLNFIGSRLNNLFGLPFYFDNIGTILTAAVGGYLPCIAVGFFYNIIAGISDPMTTYYCFVSVLIAASAAFFAEKGLLKKPHGLLLAVLVFAAIGGGLGGILTWFLNGFDFGGGAAGDIGAKFSGLTGMSRFAGDYLATFLLDLCDKLISTAVSLIIWKLLPLRFIGMFRIFRRQEVIPSEKKRIKRLSLQAKIMLLVGITSSLVAFSAIGVSINQYHNATVQEYIRQGDSVTAIMAKYLDRDTIKSYLNEGKQAEGYLAFEHIMDSINACTEEITYIYVYQVLPEGCRVVFDLDTPELAADKPGSLIIHDDPIAERLLDFLAGKQIEPIVVNGRYGWLLTVYRPLYDNDGSTLCYAAVDMKITNLLREEFSFLTRVISIFLGLLMLILVFALWIANHHFAKPINTIAAATSAFAYNSQSARRQSLERMKALYINTGDEIENLWMAIRTTSEDTVNYIEESQRQSEKINKLQDGLILVLADLVESRDKCTGDHIRKTAAYTEIILKQMKEDGIYADILTDEYIADVIHSAPLHDIGKIHVPDSILNKPGRLTDEEFNQMRSHTSAGEDIIERAIDSVGEDSGYLREAKNLARYHHEKWNGKGYPTGLAGEDIPLSARVMAVADVFDALVSRRSYKEPFSIDKAIDIIRSDAGTHFDAKVVEAFLHAEPQIRAVAESNMEKEEQK